MPAPTHATLATFRMDMAREAEQRFGLERIVVPGVQQHPGFVAGTWTLHRATAETFVMLTYDTLESANAMRENIVANAENQRRVGIELLDVRVLEVSASVSVGS